MSMRSDNAQASLDPATVLAAAVERVMDELIAGPATDVCARMAREHLASGGKRLRARLALDSVQALGGEPGAAVPWAAACELMHNASLIHDDLQDGDRVRRGRPALWSTFGEAQAINAGDLLLMLPVVALERLEVAVEVRWQLALALARHGATTARGQADEMGLRGDVHMDKDAYLRAARGKTAGLFGMPVEGAALLVGRSREDARRLAAPFENLGLLYQLQDDVIDLYGDKGRGERGADIREGKVSALAVAHVALHPEDRLWLASILRTPRDRTTDAMVDEVVERFAVGGALEEVLGWIDGLSAEVDGPVFRDEPALRCVAAGLRDRFMAPLAQLSLPGSGR